MKTLISARASAMRCPDVSPLLAVRDELDPPTAAAVDAHLDACPACAAALADERLIVTQLRNLPMREPPPGFESRLLALPTASPLSLAPVLSERVVWMLVVAATALTAWSLWHLNARHPDGLRPVPPSHVAESGRGLQGESDVGAGPNRPDPFQVVSGGPPVDPSVNAAATSGQPTVVARQRPVDLRRPAAEGVAGSTAGLVALGGTRLRNAPPARAPRAPAADRASARPGEGDEGSSADPPHASEATHPGPSNSGGANRPVKPVDPDGSVPPTAPPPTAPASACAGQVAGGQLVTVRVRVVADVAGAGNVDCPGCDGQFDANDQAMLTASGAQMPVLQVAFYARPQPDVARETTVLQGDTRYVGPGELMVAFEPTCIAADQWPLVAVVRLTTDDWAYCAPAGAEIVLDGPDAAMPTFYVHPVCPIVSPPTAEPLAVPPIPVATATSTFGAGDGPEPPPGQASP